MKVKVPMLSEGRIWGRDQFTGVKRDSCLEILRWYLASSREILVRFFLVSFSAAIRVSISSEPIPSIKWDTLAEMGVARVHASSVLV